MFADGGQWVAAVLAVGWAAAVLHAEAVRRGRWAGPAAHPGVLAALGVAVLLFGVQTLLGDRIDDAGRGATGVDAAVWSAVQHHRVPGLTAVAEVLDVAGGTLGLGTAAVLAAAVLLWHGERARAALAVASPAVAGLLELAFKGGYARPRPPESGHLVAVTGFSLPSGHTLDATIILGTLALVVTGLLHRRAARVAVVAAAASAILLAGASRVYLGVHWVTDVVTGWLLGGAWLAVCAAVLVLLPRRGATPVAPGVPGGGPAAAREATAWRAEAALS